MIGLVIGLLWKLFVWLISAAFAVLGLIVTVIGAVVLVLLGIIFVVKLFIKFI